MNWVKNRALEEISIEETEWKGQIIMSNNWGTITKDVAYTWEQQIKNRRNVWSNDWELPKIYGRHQTQIQKA
jgi:hypothetical protein